MKYNGSLVIVDFGWYNVYNFNYAEMLVLISF